MSLSIDSKNVRPIIRPLSSLRFFLVILVFSSHCYLIDSHFNHFIFLEGFVGVEFFFMLSGFILAYNYNHKLETGQISKRQFWLARFARIYPLHWLMLLIFACASTHYFISFGDWSKHFVANGLLIHAFVPNIGYYFSFNGPSWSLACEQFFYLLFPCLIIWSNTKKIRFYLLAILIVLMPISMYFSTIWFELPINWLWYVNPLSRFCDFLIGMFLFKLFDRYKLIKLSFRMASFYEIAALLLFCCFYFFADQVPMIYRNSCWYWLPIALVLFTLALQQGCISHLLCNKQLIRLGNISFGFYMIHYLVIRSYIYITSHAIYNIPYPLAVLAIFFITLIFSFVSYHYFEQPISRFIKRKGASLQ